jgi:plastocyanin
MHRWWVFLHVAGVFAFLSAHGVSMYVTLRLPRERDARRVSQLLELSASSVGVMWNAIGVLLLGGILAAFTGHFWGEVWLWVSIVVFGVLIAAMTTMGTGWAKRLRTISAAMVEGTEAISSQQFEEILRSRQPYTIAGIGFGGLLLILWLMLFKPTFGLGGDPECVRDPQADVTVCAFDEQAFVPSRLEVPAGEPIGLAFSNEDEGVPHNVAIYTDDSAEESLFVGDQFVGPDETTYEVPPLDAGSYYFRCDVHPIMDGTLEVT